MFGVALSRKILRPEGSRKQGVCIAAKSISYEYSIASQEPKISHFCILGNLLVFSIGLDALHGAITAKSKNFS